MLLVLADYAAAALLLRLDYVLGVPSVVRHGGGQEAVQDPQHQEAQHRDQQ